MRPAAFFVFLVLTVTSASAAPYEVLPTGISVARSDTGKYPGTGVWQINSVNGDLQFCFEQFLTLGAALHLPNDSCIRLDFLTTTLEAPPRE
jgi:hypothetical protein